QMLDVSDRNTKKVEEIHKLKTAVFIKAAMLSGALVSKKINKKKLNMLSNVGEKTGLAFQIIDDIVEIEKGTKFTGKSQVDIRNEKMTYPAVYGLKKSKEKVKELFKDIKIDEHYSEPLKKIISLIFERV
ncbi:MAG: polyprenyl synthetase family protein, partial [bacterium]|nr:polyprenyl synthetase family protein [bacterium]